MSSAVDWWVVWSTFHSLFQLKEIVIDISTYPISFLNYNIAVIYITIDVRM